MELLHLPSPLCHVPFVLINAEHPHCDTGINEGLGGYCEQCHLPTPCHFERCPRTKLPLLPLLIPFSILSPALAGSLWLWAGAGG